MTEILHRYVEKFNSDDEEIYSQHVPNSAAEEFLSREIPLIECPDKELEEVYYFRWWTFRKHVRMTEAGPVITEFLPDVCWSGPYNTINCPACFHIREGRWLRDTDGIVESYIRFWLDGKGHADSYSSWLPHAVTEYCDLKGDYSLAVEKLPEMIDFFRRRDERSLHECGLYYSIDDRDGMEFSIGGSGFRPTASSYAYADAVAIAKVAEIAGENGISREFREKADRIRSAMDKYMWRDGFYRTIPYEKDGKTPIEEAVNVDEAHHVRELVGYIPWYFCIPGEDKSEVFSLLRDESVFAARYGITCADMGHPRFMEAHDHACLWNGPVWPFATSQTLVAASNLLRHYGKCSFTKDDYYYLLRQYAESHRLTREDGRVVRWIDENMDPFDGTWTARSILMKQKGEIYERGKDYNHSLFCDLVLSGLFGISVKDGRLVSEPMVPDTWDFFKVENLWLGGKRYRVIYKNKKVTIEMY